MCPRGDTPYFLEVERIVIDQHFKANMKPAKSGYPSAQDFGRDLEDLNQVRIADRAELARWKRCPPGKDTFLFGVGACSDSAYSCDASTVETSQQKTLERCGLRSLPDRIGL